MQQKIDAAVLSIFRGQDPSNVKALVRKTSGGRSEIVAPGFCRRKSLPFEHPIMTEASRKDPMAHNDTKPQYTHQFSQRKQPQSFGRRCGLCELPLDAERPAISLKSGSRVHLECYHMLQKRARGT